MSDALVKIWISKKSKCWLWFSPAYTYFPVIRALFKIEKHSSYFQEGYNIFRGGFWNYFGIGKCCNLSFEIHLQLVLQYCSTPFWHLKSGRIFLAGANIAHFSKQLHHSISIRKATYKVYIRSNSYLNLFRVRCFVVCPIWSRA